MALEPIGIKRTCPGCGTYFAVCRSCWRGHWYCSSACSGVAKARVRQRANKRYRSSTLGRFSQQQAQKRYRRKVGVTKSVRDHSSKKSKTFLLNPPVQSLPRELKSESLCFMCRSCGKEITFFVDGRRFIRPIRARRRGST